MPLPPVRCRFYQDDGTPIRDGCWRRESCGFVHPGEPNWDSASTKDISRDGNRGGGGVFGGRGRGRAPPSRLSSALESNKSGGKTNSETQSWSQPSGGWGTTGDTSSGWDSSSWGAPTSSAPEFSKGRQADEPSSLTLRSVSGRGGSVDESGSTEVSKNEAQRQKKSSGEWGATGDSSSGWDSSSWGAPPSSASDSSKEKQIGSSSSLTTGSGTGRGSSFDGGMGGKKSIGKTQGRGKSGVGWGTTDDTSSGEAWDARNEGADTRSSGWGTGGGWGNGTGWGNEDSSSGGWGTSGADLKLSRTTTDEKDVSSPTKSEDRLLRADPYDLDHRIEADSSMSDRPHTRPLGDLSPTFSERSIGIVRPVKSVARRPPPAAGKMPFRLNVIQILNDAVGIQLEINDRQADYDRWTIAQKSIRFARVGQSARTKLDSIREEYDTKLLSAKQFLERTMPALTELPETSRSSLAEFNPDLDEKALIQYTVDLKDWVESVRKHLIMVTAPPVQRLAPLPAIPIWYEKGQIDGLPPAKRQRLSLVDNPQEESNDFTYDGFISQISRLEDRMQQALEQLEEVKVFHLNPNLPDAIARKSSLPPGNDKLGVLELSERTDNIGTNLSNQAERAATVFTKVHNQEQQLQALDDINEGYQLLKTQIQDQLSQFEQSRRQHSEQIRTISEQIQGLHARRAPTPIPSPIFAVEDLVPRVDSTVHDVLQQELLPVLEGIRVDCSTQVKHCNQQIYTDIWKNLQPTLMITDNVYRYMESTNVEKEE